MEETCQFIMVQSFKMKYFMGEWNGITKNTIFRKNKYHFFIDNSS